jgi:hypothetical protein
MAKFVVLLLTPRTYLPMEIFSFSKGFRLQSLSGSFTQALLDLTRRGQKVFFKLKNIFNNIPCSALNVMHIFDHTVKPVLLYASQIVGLFKVELE